MGVYKHCVSMRLDRREIVEVHDDYVVVREYLTPDPRGPFLVMSNYGEPEWATRDAVEPRHDCPPPVEQLLGRNYDLMDSALAEQMVLEQHGLRR